MSVVADAWSSWLRCPRCAGSCTALPVACNSCGFAYPSYGGIPVVMARPHELVDQWRFRLAEFETTGESSRARLIADLATKPLGAGARARIERLAEGMALQRERIGALLRQAGLTPGRRTAPEPDGVPTEGSITSYVHHVHRDWGWDDDGSTENREAYAAVEAVLGPDPSLGNMLVIGAGSCRLASDLHRHATLTIAIDINPLPMIVARRVLDGERVRLVELPLAPPDLEHVYVERELHAADPNGDDCLHGPPGLNLVQLFADAFALPFRDRCFDTVVTPWFIDQVPRDIATFLPEIHRMLRPGGKWINHGPLIYHPSRTEVGARYAADELFELVATAGFAVHTRRVDRLPYLQSPACTRGRAETVWTFVATADARPDTPAIDRAISDAPIWTDDPRAVVPKFAGLERYQAPHPMFATIARLIDGVRTGEQIAAVLVRDYKVPADAATGGVLSCLREIWRATNAGA